MIHRASDSVCQGTQVCSLYLIVIIIINIHHYTIDLNETLSLPHSNVFSWKKKNKSTKGNYRKLKYSTRGILRAALATSMLVGRQP